MDRCYCVIFLILGICILLLTVTRKNNKEFYGGPVKNIRKIPISDCYRNCDMWMANCIKNRRGDEHRCVEMGEACRMECYYTNSHRQ